MAAFHPLTTLATLILVTWLASPAFAQAKLDERASENLKLSKAEMTQFKALASLVDSVIGGKEPAPADLSLSFQSYFIRSATNLFVPYVLDITGARLTSFPVGLYVRAVRKGVMSAAEGPVFTDVYFIANADGLVGGGQGSVQLSRAMELPPGDFDVHVAMMETPPRNGRTPPKRVVHTQSISVPDLASGLTTSSILLARSLEEAPQQLTARQQMEQPFTIGGQRLIPALTPTFSKAAELLFMFLVYNEGATPDGKPDLEIGYTMSRGTEAKAFAKMPSTLFNATTLPAEFSMAAGHQVMVVQGVPLASLAAGEYTLTIAITDKTSGQSISRAVPFTVTP